VMAQVDMGVDKLIAHMPEVIARGPVKAAE
jgi:hypothetical protein